MGSAASKSAEAEVAPAPVIEPVRFEAPLPKARAAVTPKLLITAKLCGELARVAESRELPHLLERAARVLDASGIIVWIAEPSRQALVPALAHGYEQRSSRGWGASTAMRITPPPPHIDRPKCARSLETRYQRRGDRSADDQRRMHRSAVCRNEGRLRERRERSGARHHLRRTARDNRRHACSRLCQSRRPRRSCPPRAVTVYEQ